MSQVSSDLLEQLEQQQTLIAQLKHLVRQNEDDLKDKEKQLQDTSSKFKKFKLQSRAKINQLSSQVKETATKDDESEDSSTHSAESTDPGSRAKVILLRKQLEDSRLRYEKQEQNMKDQITCLQSTVQQMEQSKIESAQVLQQQSDDIKNEPKLQIDKGQQELYAQIVYKDSKILDLNNQILELERKIMDLQENVREKDQVLLTRNKAIQLMTEEMNRRGQAVEEELNETRREMREMQERFASAESSWQEEKGCLQELLQTVKEDETQLMQKELKSNEAARFDLAKRNAELQEKVVYLQEKLQTMGDSQQQITQTIGALEKELALKEQSIAELQKSSEEAASTTDNRILKARAKERSKLKVAERQIEELKKVIEDHEKEEADLRDQINRLELSIKEMPSTLSDEDQVIMKDADCSKDLEQTVAKHVAEIHALTSSLATATSKIAELESTVKSLADEKSILEADLQNFKTLVQKHEQTCAEQLLNIQNLMDVKSSLEATLKEVFSLFKVKNFQELCVKFTEQEKAIDFLSAKNVEIESKLEDLTKKESQLNNLILENKELNQKFNEIQKEALEYSGKISELELCLKSFEEGTQALSNDKAEKEFENESLQKKIKIKEKRIGSLEDQLQLSNSAVKELENAKQALEKSLKDIFAFCDVSNLKELHTKWKAQEEGLKYLNSTIDDKLKLINEQESKFKMEVAELKNQRDELSSKIKCLNSDVEEKSQMIKILEDFKSASLQDNQSKETTYLEQITAFQTEVLSLTKLLNEKEKIKQKLEDENKNMANDLEASHTKLVKMKEEFDNNFTQKQDAFYKEKELIEQSLKSAEEKNSSLAKLLNEKEDIVEKLQDFKSKSLQDNQNKEKSYSETITTFQTEFFSLNQLLNEKEGIIQKLVDENKNMANDLEASHTKLVQMKEEFDNNFTQEQNSFDREKELIEQSLKSAEEKISSLDKLLNEKEDVIQKLQDENKNIMYNLEESHNKLTQMKEEFDNKFTQEHNTFDRERDLLKQSIKSAEEKIAILDEKLATSTNTMEELESTILVLNKNLTDVYSVCEVENVDNLRDKWNTVEQKIRNLVTEIETKDKLHSEESAAFNNNLKNMFSVCEVESVDDFCAKWRTQQQAAKDLAGEIETKSKLHAEQEAKFSKRISSLKEQKKELASKAKTLGFQLEENTKMLKALEDCKQASVEESKSKEVSYIQQLSTCQFENKVLEERLNERNAQIHEYEAKIQSLNEINKSLESDLEMSNNTIVQVKEEYLFKLTEEQNAHSQEKAILSTSIASSEEEISKLVINLESATHELNDLRALSETRLLEMNTLQEQITAYNTEINKMGVELQTSLQNIKYRDNEIKRFGNEIELLLAQSNSKDIALQNEHDKVISLQTEIKEYTSRIKELEDLSSNFSHQLGNAELSNSNLEQQLSDLQNEIRVQNTNLHEKYQEKETSLQTRCDTLSKQLEDLSSKYKKQAETVELIKADLEAQLQHVQNEMQTKITTLQTQHQQVQDSLQAKCNSLQKNLEEVIEKNSEMQTSSDILKAESSTWKTKFEELLLSFLDLESQLGERQQVVTSLTSERDKLLEECTELSKENDNLNTSLQNLEKQSSYFTTQLASEFENFKQSISPITEHSRALIPSVKEYYSLLQDLASKEDFYELNVELNHLSVFNDDSEDNKILCLESKPNNTTQEDILQFVTNVSNQLKSVYTSLKNVSSAFESNKVVTRTLIQKCVYLSDELVKSSELVSSLQEKVSSLFEENKQCLLANDDLKTKSSELSEALEESSSKLMTIQTQYDALANDYSICTEKFAAEQISSTQHVNALEAFKTQLESELQASKTEIDELKGTVETLQNIENSLKTDKETLEKLVSDLKQELSSSNLRLDQLQKDMSHTQNELHLAQEQVSQMNSLVLSNQNLQEMNESLEHKCINLNEVILGLKQSSDETLSELLTTNMNFKEETESLKKENDKLKLNIQSLENHMMSVDDERQGFASKYKELEQAIKQRETELKDLEIISEEFRKANATLENQIVNMKSEAESNVDELQNKIISLEDQLKEMNVSYKKLEEEGTQSNYSLTAQLTEQESNVTELEKKLSVFAEEYTTLQFQHTNLQNIKEDLENQLSEVQKQLSQSKEMYLEKDKLLESVNEMSSDSFKELESMKKKYAELEESSKEAKSSIDKYETQLQSTNRECSTLQEKIKDMEQTIYQLENELSIAGTKLSDLTSELNEKDNEILSLNHKLSEIGNEHNSLVDKLNHFEHGELSYQNLSSKLEEADEVIKTYEEKLEEKCCELEKIQQELIQVKCEINQNENTLAEKEEMLSSTNCKLNEQIDETRKIEAKMEHVMTFQSDLLQQIKLFSESIGIEHDSAAKTSLKDFLDIYSNLNNCDESAHKIVVSLSNILQEKHEALLNTENKLKSVDSLLHGLINTLSSLDDFQLPSTMSVDTNFVEVIDNYVKILLKENTAMKHCLKELGNKPNDHVLPVDNGIPNVDTLLEHNMEIEQKSNLDNQLCDLVQSKPSDVNTVRKDIALVQNSPSDDCHQELETIKAENSKLNSAIEANKLKMGKMLMKLKQLKEKNDKLSKDLQELSSLKTKVDLQLEEIERLQEQNLSFNSKVQESQSAQASLEAELLKIQEVNKTLHDAQQTTEAKVQELLVVNQQQKDNYEKVVSGKNSLEKEKESLLTQLEILKQQSDLIASDNDTFLTLVEELKTSKRQLEHDLQKLKHALTQEQNESNRIVEELSREKEYLQSQISEKDKCIFNLNNTLSEKQSFVDKLTIRIGELEAELASDNAEVASRDQEHLQLLISEKDKCIFDLNATLSEKQSYIDDLTIRIGEMETVLAHVNPNNPVKVSDFVVEERQSKHEAVLLGSANRTVNEVDFESTLNTKEDIQRLQKENESLQAIMNDLKQEIAKLTSRAVDYEKLKSHCEMLEREVGDLKSQLQNASSEIVSNQQTAALRHQQFESDFQKQLGHFQSELNVVSAQRDKLQQDLVQSAHMREKLEAEIQAVLQGNIDVEKLHKERDQLKNNIENEIEQRRNLEENYRVLHLSHHTLQSNLDSLGLDRNKILLDLQAEMNTRQELEKELDDLRNRQGSLATEWKELETRKAQEAERDAKQAEREEHLKRELQHAMQTIHQQGLRSEGQDLELGMIENDQPQHSTQILIEQATSELQQKLDTLQAELDLERQRRLLLQEEMSTNIPSTSKNYSDNEYKLIIDEEPEYIPETSYLISRNVQTKWTRVHRWLLGRRNYFRTTIKKKQHYRLLFYTYVAILHIWIMLSLF